MKLRTTKYIVKEGLINTYRNMLMSLASVGVVTASMVVLGIFLVIAINLTHNTEILKQQPQMQVFCNHELDIKQVAEVEQAIKNDSRVKKYTYVSKKEALEKAKEILGNDQDVIEGLGADFMPESFIIQLNNLEDIKAVVGTFENIQGVEKVKFSEKRVDMVLKVGTWVQVGNVVLTIILLVVSLFIISNTIKLTVFARRKEINIMKYIGATDWFIRWPFIVEGVIIGFVGAVLGFVAVAIVYGFISGNAESANISFVNLGEIQTNVIYTLSLVGVVVGALGSTISIRKYLRV